MTIREAVARLTLTEYEVVGRPEDALELLVTLAHRAEDIQAAPYRYDADEQEAADALQDTNIGIALEAANAEIAEWDRADEKARTEQENW